MILKTELINQFKELTEFLKKLHGQPHKEDLVPFLFKTEYGNACSVAVVWRSGDRQFDVSLVTTMGVCSFVARNNKWSIGACQLSFYDDLPLVQIMQVMIKGCQNVGLVPDGTDVPDVR